MSRSAKIGPGTPKNRTNYVAGQLGAAGQERARKALVRLEDMEGNPMLTSRRTVKLPSIVSLREGIGGSSRKGGSRKPKKKPTRKHIKKPTRKHVKKPTRKHVKKPKRKTRRN